MSYSEFLQCFFTKRHLYELISDEEKKIYFFLLNRQMAQVFPEMACGFNEDTTDPVAACDIYYFYARRLKYGLPYVAINPNEEALPSSFLLNYPLDEKTFRDWRYFFPDDLKKALKIVDGLNFEETRIT